MSAVGVAEASTGPVRLQARPAAPLVGNDISFPQCGKTYPSGQAFAIVGVNGGKASNFNPCFSSVSGVPGEWDWAQTSTGKVRSQAKAQLYVNTGNPGDVLAQYNVTDWPTSSDPIDPYGTCAGTWTNDLPCSWEYGYERALADINYFEQVTGIVGSASGKKWWLDIETANSWTSDTCKNSDRCKNRASLEGMAYALKQAGATVGIYSSSGAWSSLFGSLPVAASSPLYSLNEWRPGARTLSQATSNCSLAPFEASGRVELTQYVTTHLDYDYSCVESPPPA
jgi:hypothetical protein